MALQENELYLSTSRYFSYPDWKEEQFYWKIQFYLIKVGFFPSVSEMRETPRPEHTNSTSSKVSKAQELGERLKFSKILHEGQHSTQHWGGQSLITTHLKIRSRRNVPIIFILWAEDTVGAVPSLTVGVDQGILLWLFNLWWAESIWHLKKCTFNAEIHKFYRKCSSFRNDCHLKFNQMSHHSPIHAKPLLCVHWYNLIAPSKNSKTEKKNEIFERTRFVTA